MKERPFPDRPPLIGAFLLAAGLKLRDLKTALGDDLFAEFIAASRDDPSVNDPYHIYENADEILREIERFTSE